MSIEVEAALQDLYEVLESSEPTHPENTGQAVEKAAVHAYGAARELKGHVEACRNFIYGASVAGYASSQPMSEKVYCGDGWLCDTAKEIEGGR